MNPLIRPALPATDNPGIAAVLTAESPDWPTTPEALLVEDRTRDPSLHHIRFVALDTTQPHQPIIGVGTLEHDPIAPHPHKYLLDIRVPPNLQGRGIGSKLYDTIIQHTLPLHPHQLQSSVWATLTNAIQFVQHRGFRETWRRIDSDLNPSTFDATPYTGLAEHLLAQGIEIKTFSELSYQTGAFEKWCQLENALWADVPYGEPVPPKTLTQFAKETIHSPYFLPDACFIAIHQNNFIGYTNLTGHARVFVNEMTGVLPPYRGRRIATLLKLHTIQYAQRHNNLTISTTNDSVNNAMLALNTKLGFTRQGATIRFTKYM
jgi:mycothiol synthase